VVVLATALVLRLVHLWSLRASPFWDVLLGDARSYDAWGREIAAGDWTGSGVFYQSPLYAYFLRGFTAYGAAFCWSASSRRSSVPARAPCSATPRTAGLIGAAG